MRAHNDSPKIFSAAPSTPPTPCARKYLIISYHLWSLGCRVSIYPTPSPTPSLQIGCWGDLPLNTQNTWKCPLKIRCLHALDVGGVEGAAEKIFYLSTNARTRLYAHAKEWMTKRNGNIVFCLFLCHSDFSLYICNRLWVPKCCSRP